jgi:hypothetical protein
MIVRGATLVVANTDTTLYTVGGTIDGGATPRESDVQVTVSNNGATDRTFRLAVRPLGVAVTAVHYKAYDTIIPAGEQIIYNLSMLATDIVLVRASHADVVFSYEGQERARVVLP